MTPTDAQIRAAIRAMKEYSIGGELYYEEDYQEAVKAAAPELIEPAVRAAIAEER
jgi:hypothetical protein